jgi:polysaccharide deacetylase family protein (PEP-CTERM system associated)
MPEIANALTIDVEDYFQVSALAPHISRDDWDHIPCRVEANVEKLLAMLADADARATFFTLGWIAERYPDLVRRIVQEGHELASHGYGHERATNQPREVFLQDIRKAKSVLEDIAATEVKGYRAPSFSVGASNPWAFDCIAEAGYRYSSSVYPIRHDHYGMPEAPRFAYQSRNGLMEIPITTARVFNNNWPAGGGGYFRLLPYAVSRSLIRHVNQTEGRSAVFYLHPWELDPGQPRVAGTSFKTSFRHYINLYRVEPRLARLLRDFRWQRMDRLFLEAPKITLH